MVLSWFNLKQNTFPGYLWGDVELQNDPEDNREMLVWLAERGTKTAQDKNKVTREHFNQSCMLQTPIDAR